tara:strand:+ start:516 stop:1343 length:828 start_codon:yes stop_codon:yes gene_type:complete
MKLLVKILFIIFYLNTSNAADKYVGSGELKLDEPDVKIFLEYLSPPAGQSPEVYFVLSENGKAIWSTYWYCPEGNCQTLSIKNASKKCVSSAEKYYKRSIFEECKIFARKRTIIWKNGINPGKGKTSKASSKWNEQELRTKLTELGFLGNATSSSSSSLKDENKKVEKKTVKKYELQGKKALALSWEGYEDLIAGTLEFDEKNYKGNIKLSLPNDDGTCEGIYILQDNGKGTWNVSCSNNLGAAGTLKWKKNGSVTGIGTDFNNKKVKFTVSNKS